MDMLLAEISGGELTGLVGILIPLLATIGGVIALIIAVVGGHYRKLQRDDMEATLKMEMIQRGLGAEEIERILNARMATPQAGRLGGLLGAASASCPSKAASPGAK